MYEMHAHVWSARLCMRYMSIYEMHGYAYMWGCLRCTPIYKITLDVRVCEVHAYMTLRRTAKFGRPER